MSKKSLRLVVAMAVGAVSMAAPSAQAASPDRHVVAASATVAPQRAAAESGFSVVRRTAADALAMVSPSAGELWVAERGANGKIVLEHLRRGRWTSTTLDVYASGEVKLATEGGQSALVADGRLFVEDGGEWGEVLLPSVGGSRIRAVSVALGTGEDTYVGAVANIRGGGVVYRHDGRRWTSLGNPGVATPTTTKIDPAELRLVGGELLVRWRQSGGSQSEDVVTKRDDAGWERLFSAGNVSGGYNGEAMLGAWLVRSVDRQFMLGGRYSYWNGWRSWCLRYNAPSVDSCSTSQPVGAADLRADGSTVIGGIYGYSFLLRDPNGYERYLTGSAGSGVFVVEAEPGTNVTWALTRSGEGTLLQRYAG